MRNGRRRLGLVYKLTPNVSLFANVAQSFMPQSSIASYIGELPPEESTCLRSRREIRPVQTALPPISRCLIFINVTCCIPKVSATRRWRKPRVRFARAAWKWIWRARFTDNLSVIASYGYTDAKVLEDPDYAGKPLPNVPKHTGSLFLTYDIHNVYDSNTLTVGGGGHAVSKRSGTNGADYYLQGYAVADVFAAYKMKLQYPVTLQVNVKNLFDKTYYTSSIGTNNLGNQIGDPREVQFTVKMDF